MGSRTGTTKTTGDPITSTMLNKFLENITHSVKSSVIDLSGSAVAQEVVLYSSVGATMKAAHILYIEGSSADAGVALKIGKESDDNYYYDGTSETEKAAWYCLDVTLLQTAITAGEAVTVSCAGGKSGAGTVQIVIEYEESATP